MTRSALLFGAPETEPGGNVAASSSGQPRAGREPALDASRRGARGRGACSTRSSDGTATVPGRQTRCRSLRTRSTIMTFSALVLRQQAVRRRRAVPLIGADVTRSPSRAQEQLGRGGDDPGGDAAASRGRRRRPRTAPGCRRRARAASAQASASGRRAAGATAPGRGWPGRRRPRGCGARISRTPRDVRGAVEADDVQAAGGRARATGRARRGQRRAAHPVEAPEPDLALEGQRPRPTSRRGRAAAGSSVTSASRSARRPSNQAMPARSGRTVGARGPRYRPGRRRATRASRHAAGAGWTLADDRPLEFETHRSTGRSRRT